jgi:2-haloacid dehalogenase
MMVAAHNYELIGASVCGFATAFVLRATEYGPKQTTDLQPEKHYDVVASAFLNLAEQLGC